jgi:glycosyltransferase involved in cell wall biosynthesis
LSLNQQFLKVHSIKLLPGRCANCILFKMISVITAHLPRPGAYLCESYNSLLEQDVNWEWIIQIDGEKFLKKNDLPILNDPRVKVELTGKKVTQAIVRNLALQRSSGKWIYSLDDDDKLFPGALKALRKGLIDYPEAACALGTCLKVSDEKEEEWSSHGVFAKDLYKPGLLQVQEIVQKWLTHKSHHLPSTATFWRKEKLLEVGGYPGLFGSDDTAALLYANIHNPVLLIEDKVLAYRIHDQQTVKTSSYKKISQENRQLLFQILETRGVKIPENAVRDRNSKKKG